MKADRRLRISVTAATLARLKRFYSLRTQSKDKMPNASVQRHFAIDIKALKIVPLFVHFIAPWSLSLNFR